MSCSSFVLYSLPSNRSCNVTTSPSGLMKMIVCRKSINWYPHSLIVSSCTLVGIESVSITAAGRRRLFAKSLSGASSYGSQKTLTSGYRSENRCRRVLYQGKMRGTHFLEAPLQSGNQAGLNVCVAACPPAIMEAPSETAPAQHPCQARTCLQHHRTDRGTPQQSAI
jgi:hypothetical protein